MLARTAPIVVALSLVGLTAPAATASTRDVTLGGCDWVAPEDPTAPGDHSGVMYVHTTTTGRDGLPIGATVTCKLQKNGVDVPGTTFAASGDGVQVGYGPVSYTIDDIFDYVGACQRTVYADGTDTGWSCEDGNLVLYLIPPPYQQAPQEVDNIIETYLDPSACPVLAAHPGSYGPVTIGDDGDVSVADPLALIGLVYDCPPYAFD